MAERVAWSELRQNFAHHIEQTLRHSIPVDSPIYGQNLDFARSRFEEGQQLASFLKPYFPAKPVRVLDVGSGNGGVSLALANDDHFRVFAIDITPNADFLALRKATSIPARQIVARGEHLPFRENAFDAVLCLETIEHIPHPESVGHELMRVLRSGGMCMVTTPARMKFLFRPDPHFGVKNLVAWPDGMQRKIVTGKLRLTPDYDVEHIFWTAGGVIRNFPKRARVKTLCNIPYPGIPSNLREWLWYACRRLLWDRILIWKR